MTERELKETVKRLARLQGWRVRDEPQAQNFRAVKGESTGYPDLVLVRDGQVMWWELKTDSGAQTAEQYAWSLILPAYHLIRPKDLDNGRVNELLS